VQGVDKYFILLLVGGVSICGIGGESAEASTVSREHVYLSFGIKWIGEL
jgi:hypothetical protein